MKNFQTFITEAEAASATSSSISRSVTGGSSDASGPSAGGFQKRNLNPLEIRRRKLKRKQQDQQQKPQTQQQKPQETSNVKSGVRKPQPYRQANRPKTPEREKGGPLAKRQSMVQKKTAAAQQPPQHKQISARPASTAMAGSRQRPAIKPQPQRKALPTSNVSRYNNDIQKAKVKVQEPQQKALPPAQQRQKALPPAQPQQKALPPAQQRQKQLAAARS